MRCFPTLGKLCAWVQTVKSSSVSMVLRESGSINLKPTLPSSWRCKIHRGAIYKKRLGIIEHRSFIRWEWNQRKTHKYYGRHNEMETGPRKLRGQSDRMSQGHVKCVGLSATKIGTRRGGNESKRLTVTRTMIERRAVTTPVLIVQRVIIFKTVSVLTKMRIRFHPNHKDTGRQRRKWGSINALFETCLTRTQ
jgi:hypothetical protein